MHAIGYRHPGSIDRESALVDIDQPSPTASGSDLLVEVKGISVNPVDIKIRQSSAPDSGEWKVLGWDAAGLVKATGPDATRFKPGDEVFYAGSLTRPGANAQLHLVDERIVGRKPASLDWAAAAALPLTSITAWEMLFDRLDVTRPVPGATPAILIVGGAGGVGSIAIQLARTLTDLTVIATASRDETRAWCTQMGAHHVIDHSQPLAAQVASLGLGAPALVFSTTHTDHHLDDIAKLIAPQARLGLIDDPQALDINPFKRKSVAVHWEFMFTRSMFGTPDIAEQGRLLDEVSRLVDAGTLKSTMTEHGGAINAANLKRAHALIESHRSIGKVVLEGFGEARV